MLDLKYEADRRDVTLTEVARRAGVDRRAVVRIANGESAGRASTRRRIREALKAFPPVDSPPVDLEALAR